MKIPKSNSGIRAESFKFQILTIVLFRRCQVTGLNGVTFLDRTRMVTEGPPGTPPQAPAYQVPYCFYMTVYASDRSKSLEFVFP